MTSLLERLPSFFKWSAAMLTFGALLAPSLRADIAVVTRESTPIEVLEEDQVKALWLGTIERIGGIKLTVADRSDDQIRARFYSQVLHKTRGQVKAIRAKRAFQYGIAPPPEFPGDESILQWVRARENRLGYVDAEAVDQSTEDPADDAVKVLLLLEVPNRSDEP